MTTYLLLDPRPQARAEMLALLAEHAPVLGIEVTIPELAAACAINIDPQHTDGMAEYAAIESVAGYVEELADFQAMATVRADLDSVGAMAALTMYQRGIRRTDEMNIRIGRIATHDKFAFGPWQARPLAKSEIDWELRGLGALIGDFKRELAERVELMIDWLTSGTCAGFDSAVEQARREWAIVLANSHVEERDGIAVVISPHRFAMEIGYALAPVVVAANPAMRVNGDEPHLKYMIAAWPNSGALDLAGVLREVLMVEPGWGGNVAGGIIGSPQGVGSRLELGALVALVRAYLR